MQDLLLVSRWFYPANISLLAWLSLCALFALVSLCAVRVLEGVWRRGFAIAAMVLAGFGVLASIVCISVEVVVFEFGSPMSVVGYSLLASAFVGMTWQSRSRRSLGILNFGWSLLASGALVFLFFFGSIPQITELRANELMDIEGSNVLGRESSAVSITEFADFECPPCARQDSEMERLWSQYSDRIRYSFRHFPKRKHAYAEPAALASQCAAEQGMFWETKRLLFANQERLGEVLAQPDLPTIPAAGARKYAECVKSRSGWDPVSQDLHAAEKIGLRVTPSIIIGNKLIQGTVSYGRLAVMVKRELRDRSLLPPRSERSLTSRACGSPLRQACIE